MRRTYFYLMLLMFNALGSMFNELRAQDENAAFYIYRNDGDFDGFFFDEVVRMGYSKFDLDSVEYDFYVMQEIETKDSLYRIPLAAIDSIGFQQPEIKFNSRLRLMDDLGLTDYVTNVSMDVETAKLRIAFGSALPAILRPNVGDVLAGFDSQTYGDEGFVGKVIAVQTEGGLTVCECAFVDDWGDIFEQVISVEQIGTDASGNVRRRVAGMPRRVSGNYDLTLFNWSGRLQKELYHSGNESVNVGLDLGFNAAAQAVYNISGVFSKRAYMKVVFREGFSAGLSVHANLSSSHEWQVSTPLDLIPAVKFPAFFPIFECDPKPKGFVRIGGSVDLGVQLPKYDFGFSQTFIIDSETDYLLSFTWGNLDKNENDFSGVDGEFSGFGAGLVLNGFIQFGSKVSLAVKNNSWLNSLLECSVGLDIYAGPKMEAELNFNLGAGNDDYNLIKDSKVEISTVSFDRELKYSWRTGRRPRQERTIWQDTQKFGTVSWYFLPDFLNTQVDINEAQKQIAATIFPRRMVLLPSTIGIGVYDKDNKLIVSRFGRKYSFANTFSDYKASFSFGDFPAPGKYTICPIIENTPSTPLYAKGAGATVKVPAYLNIETDSLVLSYDSKIQRVPYEANVEGIDIWLDGWYVPAELTKDENGQRYIVITPGTNNSAYTRRGKVILHTYGNGHEMSDTLIVRQLGTDNVANIISSIKVNAKWYALQNGYVNTTNTENATDEHITYNNEKFPMDFEYTFENTFTGENRANYTIVRQGEKLIIDALREMDATEGIHLAGDEGKTTYKLHMEMDVSAERQGKGELKCSCTMERNITAHTSRGDDESNTTEDRETHLKNEAIWGKDIGISLYSHVKSSIHRKYYHYGTTDYYDYERDISYTMQSSAEKDNRRVNVDIKWNLSE